MNKFNYNFRKLTSNKAIYNIERKLVDKAMESVKSAKNLASLNHPDENGHNSSQIQEGVELKLGQAIGYVESILTMNDLIEVKGIIEYKPLFKAEHLLKQTHDFSQINDSLAQSINLMSTDK